MKIDILIVDVALLALVLVPYLIFILVGSKTANKSRKRFKQIASENGLVLTEQESWNANLVGLDRIKEKFLFIQLKNGEPVSELVDLKMLKSCSVISETEKQKINGKMDEILKRVSLEFVFLNATEKKLLDLYDHEINIYQDYELKRAQKWSSLINELLKTRQAMRRAA